MLVQRYFSEEATHSRETYKVLEKWYAGECGVIKMAETHGLGEKGYRDWGDMRMTTGGETLTSLLTIRAYLYKHIPWVCVGKPFIKYNAYILWMTICTSNTIECVGVVYLSNQKITKYQT